MEFDMILQLIGSYAFPIIACIALFKKSYDDERMHKEEVDKLRDVLAANTEALIKIGAILDER